MCSDMLLKARCNARRRKTIRKWSISAAKKKSKPSLISRDGIAKRFGQILKTQAKASNSTLKTTAMTEVQPGGKAYPAGISAQATRGPAAPLGWLV